MQIAVAEAKGHFAVPKLVRRLNWPAMSGPWCVSSRSSVRPYGH